jgi:hypothetical protein
VRMLKMIPVMAAMIAVPAFAAPDAAPMTPKPAADQTITPAQVPASEPAAAPAPAPVQPTPAEAIAAQVKTDWAKYDADGKPELSRAEFGKWMTDLRTSASQSAPDAAWLKTAFGQSDTDKNAKVSETELTKFLVSGS